MVDRLYENILELIRNSQEQYCNSILCNLNAELRLHLFKKHRIVIVYYVI